MKKVILLLLLASVNCYAIQGPHLYESSVGEFRDWSKQNVLQNKEAKLEEINFGGVSVQVPAGWFYWGEKNGDIQSLKISKFLDAEVAYGAIIFLNERKWNEDSLESARKTYSRDKKSKVFIEKWGHREWLVSEALESGRIKITIRAQTHSRKFKWAIASGPKDSKETLMLILKSVEIK